MALHTLPGGQVVKAEIRLDGRVEVRCPCCDGILYHDAVFTDDVVNQLLAHKRECALWPRHPEPADD